MGAPALPQRKPNLKPISKIYNFSDFVNASNEDYSNNMYSFINVDDANLVKDNFELLEKLIKTGNYDKINSNDFDCLKFIESNLDSKYKINLCLVNDFENKDRSYINTELFEKNNIIIPMTYSLWDANIKEDQLIYCYNAVNSLNPMINRDFAKMNKDFLSYLKETLLDFKTETHNMDEIEKIIYVSNYLQNKVQYVDVNNVSEATLGTYITDSGKIVVNRNTHSPETVLRQSFGLCEGIANATTLLLNNSILDVNANSAFGSGHVWNTVKINDKYYYVDNTWAITRNNNQFEESLKAKEFDSNYLFFGLNTAARIRAHEPITAIPDVELTDFNKEIIDQKILKLQDKINFNEYEKPVFKSYIMKK